MLAVNALTGDLGTVSGKLAANDSFRDSQVTDLLSFREFPRHTWITGISKTGNETSGDFWVNGLSRPKELGCSEDSPVSGIFEAKRLLLDSQVSAVSTAKELSLESRALCLLAGNPLSRKSKF